MGSKRTRTKHIDEPMMSDKTILMTVDDLINIAFGPAQKNVVNHKMIQEVLYILARQLRLLERQVEIRINESPESPESPTSRAEKGKRKTKTKKETETDKRDGKDRAVSGDRDDESKADRAASREREKEEKTVAKEKDRAERAVSKERDKADRAASKERDKADRAASKEREKEERQSTKEKEKAEKMEIKEKQKEERQVQKDKEKAEREAEKAKQREEKEKDRADKHASKEKEKEEKASAKADKASTKEKEKMDKIEAKERERAEKDKERATAKGAKDEVGVDRASIKEKEKLGKGAVKVEKATAKDKENLGKDTSKGKEESSKARGKARPPESSESSIEMKGSRTRIGSIEVVTKSEFELLKAAVQNLAQKAGPLPLPALPDNLKLRSDLAKGSASLTDTMQAMQVTARVNAAEEATTRMAGLLTQLAAAGALPDDIASKIEGGLQESIMASEAARLAATQADDGHSRAGVQSSITPRKSVAIEKGAYKDEGVSPSMTAKSLIATKSSMGARSSMVARPSTTSAGRQSVAGGAPCVTREEMDGILLALKEELAKNIQLMSARATTAADVASNCAKSVADKLDVALKLDSRISTLYSLTSDYAEQLSGFDAGLTTQMLSFQEQMGQMRSDLKGGLTLLASANSNAETAAVMELTERYEGLVSELDRTSHAHQSLTGFQKQLGDELRGLVESVEMLREQKADRDEVLDGLRDKADISRLAGLLKDEDFVDARSELGRRLELCYDKFKKQDAVWLCALRDLTTMAEGKAEILHLLSLRENTQDQLNQIDEQLRKLADILGEPKAAILTRKLGRDATCGACMSPALMEPEERTFGEPTSLPPMIPRPRPLGREDPCRAEWTVDKGALKSHACKRWVGGSHTLLSEGVTRERAPPLPLSSIPTRRYAGYGDDGQLYMMEEELQPCVECNQLVADQVAGPKSAASEPVPSEAGAGDQR